MKNRIIEKIKEAGKALAKIGLGLVLLGTAVKADAQVGLTPRWYALTNSTTLTATTPLVITGNATSNINSAPFPVYRDRGFGLWANMVASNATTASVTFGFDFTNSQTGWSTTHPIQVPFALNSTTPVNAFTNISKTIWDNATAARLATIANGHSNSITVSNSWATP